MNAQDTKPILKDWYDRIAEKNGVSRSDVVEYVKRVASGIVPKKRLSLLV